MNETQSLLDLSSAGKFCLAHGLSQLKRDTKSDTNLQTLPTRHNKKFMMLVVGCLKTLSIKIEGKK